MIRLIALLFALLLPVASTAGSYDNIVRAELRPGWRLPNGDHMAALHLTLAPGWKTYWRAPGDAGIPPTFDWRGARNVQAIQVEWPAPQVFWKSGMRSVGYEGEMVLPLRISLRNDAKDNRLKGVIDIGICKDVCLPHRVRVETVLDAGTRKPDPVIAAALASLPFGPEDAEVTKVACKISAAPSGMGLRVEISMPQGTGREETVIESKDPEIWITEPKTSWQGGTLIAEARVSHMSSQVFALDRSGLRITVLGGEIPLDIHGCTG
ncbi:protein-disulfide reductase DsbD domain-containing protein [Tropicibacter naphthalenivorans]|uniref:Thiol:disulfide interchange protein DsbD N-terminal domain-containing protein n=1 Tax=Tropicibacter naphthalenivorans TaxID=441103 RepID=A0A0P1G0R0_9RHOB|nr:protein-disulfide reductase DsbD domain-containing protein [Tropicibacter naphthalenivorans]CUH75076.1 putative protein predicted to be involved in C-type cytochrome biogenesis [Tropicibacter naphthalenivorans]SMC46907.1 Thiol-disulfide interchange protein, contains DsbC and DsbD domains [Tropicibacter naphthalenivorans]